MQRAENGVQNGIAYFVTTFERVVPVDQHLGLDDRHDAFALADRRVTGQHFGVGFDAQWRRISIGHAVDFTPLGEPGALRLVGLQSLGESIKALGDEIAVGIGQRRRALVHLDARQNALAHQHFGQRRAIVRFLAERFLEQDEAGNEFAHASGRE